MRGYGGSRRRPRLFQWHPALAQLGKSKIKLGGDGAELELLIGPAVQTLMPPSWSDGFRREWVSGQELFPYGAAAIPDSVLRKLGCSLTEYNQPIDYNSCLECKLCVAACPVGAISADGRFDMSACYTHNYREFMGGFADWVEQVADAKNALAYRRQVNSAETVSMWQSLAFGPNYKAAYCLAVCPAGEDVIGADVQIDYRRTA